MSADPRLVVRRAQQVLAAYEPDGVEQHRLREQYLAHLEQHPRGLWREGPRHLTASCFVLSPDGDQVLLTLHRKGGFWVQPGGHVESTDACLADAALREMREETGVNAELPGAHPGPFDLHRHLLSASFGRCREHLDVAYVALAEPQSAVRVSTKGLLLSLACGIFMVVFNRFVAAAIYPDPTHPVAGLMGSYAAVFVFAVGVLRSNFLWSSLAMRFPVMGDPVPFSHHWRGGVNIHLASILGGVVWGIGMSLNIIASG